MYFNREYTVNLDHQNPGVRRCPLDAVDTQAEIVDGFRCDVTWAVSDAFWQEVRDHAGAKGPEFLFLDETTPYIVNFHEGMFDIYFDTALYFALRQVDCGDEPAEHILDVIKQRTQAGSPGHTTFIFCLKNHDETHYIVECGEDKALAATNALFMLLGVSIVYGGQEISQCSHRDVPAQDHVRDDIHERYERFIGIHDETPVLRHDGASHRVDCETGTDRIVAFVRNHDGSSYLCALNFTPGTTMVDVSNLMVDATDIVSGDSVATEGGVRVGDVIVHPLT